MKKSLVIVAALCLLASVGCKKQSPAPSPTPTNPTADANRDNGNVISDIAAAVTAGRKMKCTYTDPTTQPPASSIVYFDGQNFRAESTVQGKQNTVVFRDGTMSTWATGEPQGMQFTKKCMEDLKKMSANPAAQQPATQVDSTEDYLADSDNMHCEGTGTVDLSIPRDIQFTDLCQMMQQQLDAIKMMQQ